MAPAGPGPSAPPTTPYEPKASESLPPAAPPPSVAGAAPRLDANPFAEDDFRLPIRLAAPDAAAYREFAATRPSIPTSTTRPPSAPSTTRPPSRASGRSMTSRTGGESFPRTISGDTAPLIDAEPRPVGGPRLGRFASPDDPPVAHRGPYPPARPAIHTLAAASTYDVMTKAIDHRLRVRIRYDSFFEKRNDDGTLDFAATVEGLREIVWWVLRYGNEATVLRPAKLSAMIREHAEAIATMYSGSSGEYCLVFGSVTRAGCLGPWRPGRVSGGGTKLPGGSRVIGGRG